MKKLCVLCHKSKAIHFFRPNQWAKEKRNRCSECLRTKNPVPGKVAAKAWSKSMTQFLAPSTSRPGKQLFVARNVSLNSALHKSF